MDESLTCQSQSGLEDSQDPDQPEDSPEDSPEDTPEDSPDEDSPDQDEEQYPVYRRSLGPGSSSDTEFWSGDREDNTGSRRSSRGGTTMGHLPVLTIEPPSDSSVDMSDRSVPADEQILIKTSKTWCSTNGTSLKSSQTCLSHLLPLNLRWELISNICM